MYREVESADNPQRRASHGDIENDRGPARPHTRRKHRDGMAVVGLLLMVFPTQLAAVTTRPPLCIGSLTFAGGPPLLKLDSPRWPIARLVQFVRLASPLQTRTDLREGVNHASARLVRNQHSVQFHRVGHRLGAV